MIILRRSTLWLVIALALAGPGLAHAQEQKPATQEQTPEPVPTESEPDTKLAPVLVTAPPLLSSSSEQMIPGLDFELRPHGRPADVLRLIPA